MIETVCFVEDMKIKTLSDKGISTLNEDELLVQDDLFAVFDGCGSLGFLNN